MRCDHMAHEAGVMIDVRAGGSLTIRDTAYSDADQSEVFEQSRIFHSKSAGFRGAVILSPDPISKRRDVAPIYKTHFANLEFVTTRAK